MRRDGSGHRWKRFEPLARAPMGAVGLCWRARHRHDTARRGVWARHRGHCATAGAGAIESLMGSMERLEQPLRIVAAVVLVIAGLHDTRVYWTL